MHAEAILAVLLKICFVMDAGELAVTHFDRLFIGCILPEVMFSYSITRGSIKN